MYFKSQFSQEARKQEALRVINKFPDRIPVICEKNMYASKTCPTINKTKFLVPRDITLGEFLGQIRRRFQLKSNKSMFFFVNNAIMPSSTSVMEELYRRYADSDYFLYITYTEENVFGCCSFSRI